ncbi:aldolase/citrate lyase family protein [Defluviimonas sp. WL0002]|uniref:Aldolase/citrate lyase family protein n=1 Tax=Albidovulum marisflavi TaxID=2984159 RepID=A0ABT2ZEW4_9RHOB|nr:aldolase/citrate lyase family protein [Defluviimonas sp. WL0002]MCV2869631.1 aldolase/citrate lyase family protein [Defluviimonas sp. WL0002]
MKNPRNRFKAALQAGRQQIGLWNTIGGNTVPELLAGCGFDWVVIDTEHSPVEAVEVLPALQAMAAWPEVSPVVRPAFNDPVLIKRILDFGAQTLVLPYIQSAEEARAAVRAVRYPPAGIRGVAGMTRASRYGAVDDYIASANAEICLVLQVETRAALDALDEIAAVEGVDGIFIGPADLAASLGHPGNPGHPEVVTAIEGAITRLKEIGKPSGILTLNEAFARRCMELGTTFTAVGVDLAVLADGVKALRARF